MFLSCSYGCAVNLTRAVLRTGTMLGLLGAPFAVQAGTIVSAPNTPIVNDATITGTGSAGLLITNTATGSSLTNRGTITSDITAVDSRSTLGHFINSGVINGAVRGVMIDYGTSATIFNNTGTIQSDQGTALDMQGQFGNLVNLGTLISNGTNATLIIADDQTAQADVILNGTVTNTSTQNNAVALSVMMNQTGQLINTGTITAHGNGVAQARAVQFGSYIPGVFINRGTVNGQIVATTGAQSLINEAGTMTGHIDLGEGANQVIVRGGTVTGSVTMGQDDDVLDVSGGMLQGAVALGDGANHITLGGGQLQAVGVVTAGTGDDHVTITGGVHQADGIDLGNGQNRVDVTGGRLQLGNHGLVFGNGDDEIRFQGGTITGPIDFGGGQNTLAVLADMTFDHSLTSSGTVDLSIANGNVLQSQTPIGGLRHMTLASQSRWQINQHHSATGTLVNDGQIIIAADKNLTVGSYDAASTGTLGIQVGADGSFLTPGRLIVTQNGLDLSHGHLVFSIAPNSDLPPSQTAYIFAEAHNGGTITLPDASCVSDTSLLYDFTTAGDLTDTVTVTASRVAGGLEKLAGGAANGNNASVGRVLDTDVGNPNPALAALQTRLASVTSIDTMNQTLASVTPTVDTSASDSTAMVTAQSYLLATDRMADLRSGLATGDAMASRHIWAQPFASKTTQDTRDGIAGYTANSYGAIIGIDTDQLIANGTVGVAVSYGRTDADAYNINATHSQIDYYQVQAYGDYQLPRQSFVEGALTYGYSTIERTRTNVGGVAGNTARADYNSQHYMAALAIGQTWTPMPQRSPLVITPKIGVRYTHLMTGDFIETGASGLNLATATQDKDGLELSLGTQLAYPVATRYGVLTPEWHVGYTYDVIGDDIQTASRFTGGGASFATQGADPAQGTFNLGAGVTLYGQNGFDLGAHYDVQLKQDYTSHAGYMRATWAF